MAPPPSQTLPLGERLTKLAMTLQFAWFCGHAIYLLCVLRYGLSYITFNYGSRWAAFSYRTAFVAAVATYGIVVFKAYRARIKPGTSPMSMAMMLLSDENVQYLLMSLTWLFSRQIALALLPFTVYSIFHVATYTRTNLIPTISPPRATPGAGPGSPASPKPANASPVGNAIGKFVKEYYDASMMLVAGLEIALWVRLLMSAIAFQKGSWILIVIYTVFLRARFHQSPFVQGAFSHGTARIDSQVQNPNMHPVVRQGWDTIKGVSAKGVEMTHPNKFMGSAPTPQKKAA